MIRDISQLSKKPFDLLIIGGGINGCAIANEASRQGVSVALIEKGDFASGASSKTTKLIHGGIRYLEYLEFDLVMESLKERYVQLKAAPNLVKPLTFIISVYKHDPRPLWLFRFATFLYDRLAGRYLINPHKNLKAEALVALEPEIKKDGLRGGVIYYDAQMDDARLVLENMLSAKERNAVCANYTEVVSFLKKDNKAIGVVAKDVISGNIFEICAKNIICAAGPWTDLLLKLDEPEAKGIIRTTKGAHILYQGRLCNNAILASAHSDKRIFFIIPWKENTLIGTTDTDYAGSPDEVCADENDINYLLGETGQIFPKIGLRRDDIITTYAGLRPLVRSRKAGISASSVSRRHIIFKSRSGIIFVAGGKYTTYRRLACDALKHILKQTNSDSKFGLHCGDIIKEGLTDVSNIKRIADEYGVTQGIVTELIARCGVHYKDVLAFTIKDASLKEMLCPKVAIIKAQIVYSVRSEMAVTVDDIFLRRLSLWDCNCDRKECKAVIKHLMKTLEHEFH